MTAPRSLDDLADVRAGDKGDTLMLAVIPRDAAAFEVISRELTSERVADHFGLTTEAAVTRAVLKQLPALVFTLPGVLGGGVTGSTTLDGHGKTLSYHLLGLTL